MKRRIFLGSVVVGIWASSEVAAKSASPRQRLDKIINQMQKLHFCQSGGCTYQSIEVKWTPKKQGVYEAIVQADIKRRSQTLDFARYRFIYDQSWRLVGGSEATDVSTTIYKGARYESTSIYNSVQSSGAVADLPTGYQQLYFQVLNQGRERL